VFLVSRDLGYIPSPLPDVNLAETTELLKMVNGLRKKVPDGAQS
jgi:hypothetical protein